MIILFYNDIDISSVRQYLNCLHITAIHKKEPKYKERISYGKSIISHAGRLLTTTDLPVSEVMNESGFTNQTIFNRLFKNLYGMTPRQSRISTVNTEYSKESI
ncbi:helix-turn-helix domain-containing protein [Blautia luti]|uniref:helix-turn-helix domain-containing protein n=1 Tax=Blautia luti TaxID=89014 RepID=UPI0018AC6A30